MSFTHRARVLIVDDSITMRAFFNSLLERDKLIDVVGTAANADEARKLIAERNPNVITLDIEMPGMSGLDFLDEIMKKRPTPVIMLSSLTQKGAETSFEAIERGAIDCFPKPTSANREEFAQKLCTLVVAAANGSNRAGHYAKDTVASNGSSQPAAPPVAFDWNGKIVTMSASTGGVDALLQLLPAFPADCPPMVVTLQVGAEFVAPLLQRLKPSCRAKVIAVEDGRKLEPGLIQIVYCVTVLSHGGESNPTSLPDLRIVQPKADRDRVVVHRKLVVAFVDKRQQISGANRLVVLDQHLGDVSRDFRRHDHTVRADIGVVGRNQESAVGEIPIAPIHAIRRRPDQDQR